MRIGAGPSWFCRAAPWPWAKEQLLYAWDFDPVSGLFKACPPGARDNHFVACYGYEEGKYWRVFDSYDNAFKNIEWGHRPLSIKRYHLRIAPPVQDWFENAMAKFRAFLNWKPAPTPAPVEPPEAQQPAPPAVPAASKIKTWALAIQGQEGGKPSDLNMRLNNPGNLKYTPYTASLSGKLGPAGSDGGNFCKFDTYQHGFDALCQFLTDAADNKLRSYKNCTLDQFTETYARPPGKNYVNAVAKALAVDVGTPIKNLIA